MRALILAAGLGTRLLPLTRATPKPMFPVMNKPLLEHCIELLRAHNIRDIAINLHHLPDKISNYLGDGQAFGVRLTYSREETILGTAGGIKALQHFLFCQRKFWNWRVVDDFCCHL
jgi:NDP-sugar pyrophosphorylase family protein